MLDKPLTRWNIVLVLLIALAAASQLSPPQRIGWPPGWFSTSDMPAEVQSAGVTRVVFIRVVVEPDGALKSCEIEGRSGNNKLDAHTCGIVARRGKYTPARWIDGSPAYGVDRMPITWEITNFAPQRRVYEGDLNLTVNRLPSDLKSPVSVSVIVAADEGGRLLSCEANRSQYVKADVDKSELLPIACDQLMKSYTAIPPKDDQGRPVRSVQNASVRFDLKR